MAGLVCQRAKSAFNYINRRFSPSENAEIVAEGRSIKVVVNGVSIEVQLNCKKSDEILLRTEHQLQEPLLETIISGTNFQVIGSSHSENGTNKYHFWIDCKANDSPFNQNLYEAMVGLYKAASR